MSNRKRLSSVDKFLILIEYDKGGKKKDIAARYSISTSSLSIILQNRENINKQVQDLILTSAIENM